jgi:amino-acid N-acetyltransferase
MEYVEPPPAPKEDEKEPDKKIRKVQIKPDEKRKIVVKKAQVRDVQEILDLVNGYAAADIMLPRGPQYLYENIRDFVIASDHDVPVYSMMETREELHLIVACGSLHVLWNDIAEIRALAIHPDYKHLGLGSQLVEYLIEEAKQLGIKRIYTFTLTEEFFRTIGFKRQKREDLPPKMWGECSRCPKYFKCDEVGMVRVL